MKKNNLSRDQKRYFEEQLKSLGYKLHDLKNASKLIKIPVEEVQKAILDHVKYDKEVKVYDDERSYCYMSDVTVTVSLRYTPTYIREEKAIRNKAALKARKDKIAKYEQAIEDFKMKLLFGNEANELLEELNKLISAIDTLKKELA